MLSNLRGLGVVLAVAAGSGAGAGVLAPSDLAASEAARAAAEAMREGKATAPSSRAVDLLIEMQPRKVGVDFSERQGPSGGGSSLGTLPSPNAESGANPSVAPAAPAVNRAGLFGTQATPVIVREVRAATSTPSDAVPALADPHAAARNNARMEVPWWLHPTGWIDFAAEHGGWIGGLAGVMLLGWAGARAMSRRWR